MHLQSVGVLLRVQNLSLRMLRVGQNRIYAPYMTVHLVNSRPIKPYIHHHCFF